MSSDRSVLFCISSHNMWGGIESWLREILAAHREAGWRSTFAVARGKRFNDPSRFLEHFGEETAVEIDGRTGTDEGRIRAIERTIFRLEPSVVIPLALGHALPAMGRAKRAGSASRLVLSLHAMNARLLADAASFAGVIDLVVGVNPLQTDFLLGRIPNERLAVVPNGARALANARPPRSGSGIRLLLASRLDPVTKRVFDVVDLAVELVRRGIEFHCTVAGDGPAESDLREAIARHGLTSRFDLLGYVEPARLQTEIMPRCDVVMIFSAVEAFPLVALEGMAAGCVPVSSNWPGVWSAGHLRAQDNGMVFPVGDIGAAADCVESLWRNPDELARKSETARLVSREFSWERTRRLWLGEMETLLSRSAVVPQARFPMEHRERRGRLDLLPAAAAEGIRSMLRRFPDFEDGWGEWPGTLSGVSPEQERAIMAELARLDSARRDAILASA